MALVDYQYKFIYIEVGCEGRISDSGKKIVNNSLNLPPPRPLSKPNFKSWEPLENDDKVHFVFVADNAFPLTTGTMKPYPDKGLTEKIHLA